MTIEEEIQLAHERQIEDLLRDIGTLRYELENTRVALGVALDDVEDLGARWKSKDDELQAVKGELGHALAQIEGLRK